MHCAQWRHLNTVDNHYKWEDASPRISKSQDTDLVLKGALQSGQPLFCLGEREKNIHKDEKRKDINDNSAKNVRM